MSNKQIAKELDQENHQYLGKEKPPVFWMIQRCGMVVIQMLANVRRVTIEPLIKSVVLPGTLIYTDEYRIYSRLTEWGYKHKSLNNGAGEYARNEDGDEFHKVHEPKFIII